MQTSVHAMVERPVRVDGGRAVVAGGHADLGVELTVHQHVVRLEVAMND